MKLISTVAFSLFLSAHAFGPAQPLFNAVSNGSSQMQMRIGGLAGLDRRGRINDKLKAAGLAKSAEAVQQILLNEETSSMIKKSNWKLRKFMIRKIKIEASKVGLEVDANFGVP
jgi:hypothetical protein